MAETVRLNPSLPPERAAGETIRLNLPPTLTAASGSQADFEARMSEEGSKFLTLEEHPLRRAAQGRPLSTIVSDAATTAEMQARAVAIARERSAAWLTMTREEKDAVIEHNRATSVNPSAPMAEANEREVAASAAAASAATLRPKGPAKLWPWIVLSYYPHKGHFIKIFEIEKYEKRNLQNQF